MLYEAIALDAAMTASDALTRFARHGLWLDPGQKEAAAWIASRAATLGLSFDDAARMLARDLHRFGAAIRRQWGASILWYARDVVYALQACAAAAPHSTVIDALSLHEPDSRPPVPVPAAGEVPSHEGVVLDGGLPVAVSLRDTLSAATLRDMTRAQPDFGAVRGADGAMRGTAGDTATQSAHEISCWPRLDAPTYVPALVPFDVIVGLATAQRQDVIGGQVIITLPPGAHAVDVTVDLMAHGLEAPDGWSRTLHVEAADPGASSVCFRLVGHDLAGPEGVHLTTLEVRYVLGGVVCGLASRPLIVGRADAPVLDVSADYGTPWLAQPATATAVDLRQDSEAPDLTIEISKPDRDASSGRFVCRLYSPHDIHVDAGPHDIDFLDDAKTFAKLIVESVRDCAGDPLVENALDSIGDLVAEKLPAAAFDALRAVAERLAPAPPTVLIASAESCVPWELARVAPPIDASRPAFLGAQVVVGRWLRGAPTVTPAGVTAGDAAPPPRPPTQPPAQISVRNMAVMAGMYRAESGLSKLPAAEAEARALVESYDAVPLAASTQALKQLLDAQLVRGFDRIGGADVVHFAGHGEFDPTRPDSSVLFLSNGKPIPSLLFRSAKYGGAQQPLMFLNACMIGIGGEVLGEMGGFPGNCLRGGFGGVLGALWEVNDTVAAEIALEFWRRAMPRPGTAPEPVAAILRDLRAGYVCGDASTPPQSTYLSYVYFGHPRLTLR